MKVFGYMIVGRDGSRDSDGDTQLDTVIQDMKFGLFRDEEHVKKVAYREIPPAWGNRLDAAEVCVFQPFRP
ncbi:unnamed protein product [marine sediment metagenome]|uniref:Uncharacterized protein n=1 Tax=marine sediment metagenome TaxID=412755 RepID=X0Y3A8_9ZZZZ